MTVDFPYDLDVDDTVFVAPRPYSAPERAALAGVALAATLGVVAGTAPGWLPGLLGAWGALAATVGLATVAGTAFVVLRWRGRDPASANDGVFHRGLLARGTAGWIAGVAITTFYVLLYWVPDALTGVVQLADPLAEVLSGGPADRWFLYGLLYTVAVAVFGLRMAFKHRRSRYHLLRTASLVTFQLGFAFLIPQVLKGFDQPSFYAHYFWPLAPDVLLPFDYVMGPDGTWGATWDGVTVGRFMILWGAAMTFVATPVLTYLFGKRWYCSWVCGCGALAETAGDPWRHLSDPSERAWRIERWTVHGVLALIVGVTAFLWLNEATGRTILGDDGSSLFWKTYGFAIGSVFSGVIGVGAYPLLGSRVWCRFGCPMAAILGVQQRLFSRFRITTNGGQCISCGNCTVYCEMGIDVRAYAQREADVVRASCVGCGVCAEVCPRGVLKLENGPAGDRFEHADQPIRALNDMLRGRPR